MRYILSLALMLCGCTKANPDALPISVADLAMPSGGGGGAGGGGGGGGAQDLSMPGAAQDMSRSTDMAASTVGVACGTMSCSGLTPDCCVNSMGQHCVDGVITGCTNGPLFGCDGPEDCPSASEMCCLQFNGNGSRPSGTSCLFSCPGPATDPLCHTRADCPDGQGYVACCPYAQGQYRHCSKTACM
jgi:hypothetical protein